MLKGRREFECFNGHISCFSIDISCCDKSINCPSLCFFNDVCESGWVCVMCGNVDQVFVDTCGCLCCVADSFSIFVTTLKDLVSIYLESFDVRCKLFIDCFIDRPVTSFVVGKIAYVSLDKGWTLYFLGTFLYLFSFDITFFGSVKICCRFNYFQREKF